MFRSLIEKWSSDNNKSKRIAEKHMQQNIAKEFDEKLRREFDEKQRRKEIEDSTQQQKIAREFEERQKRKEIEDAILQQKIARDLEEKKRSKEIEEIRICRINECLDKLDLVSASEIALNLKRGLSATLDFSKFRECNNCLPKYATFTNIKSTPKDYILVTIEYANFKESYNAKSLGVKDVILELKNKIKTYVNNKQN
jgi:hypothetical protein